MTSIDARPDATNREGLFLVDMMRELEKARAKFPKQAVYVTLAALTEEVGELNQAILQFDHEPQKGRTPEQIYREAVQVAVMAMRVIFDCGIAAK